MLAAIILIFFKTWTENNSFATQKLIAIVIYLYSVIAA